jgi:colicin import membrane protein
MTDATQYSIPKEPGRWRAFALAMAIHAALLGVLWFSVHWQSETPIAIEAEIWSPQVMEAAPLPTPPEPEPETEAKPVPVPVPAPPPPKPVIVERPVVKPDIALAQEKKRKEKLKKELKEQDERARLDKQLAEKKQLEKEKTEALAKKRAVEEQKKLADEKQRKQERSEQTLRDKARSEDMKRMMAQAGSGGSGDAPKSQGQRGDTGYLGKVAAKIRSNTIFNVPDNLPGNQAVEYAVELLPDGSVRRPIRKIKSSGIPGFDEAVLNAIEKSQPYPPDKSGSVPSSINIIHKPKD